jgi:hypothetical protein
MQARNQQPDNGDDGNVVYIDRIRRQTALRERALGVRPSTPVTRAEAMALVAGRFASRSCLSGRPVPMDEAVLTRADVRAPFCPLGNCALLSRSELRSRSRLLSDAATDEAHAAAARRMQDVIVAKAAAAAAAAGAASGEEWVPE